MGTPFPELIRLGRQVVDSIALSSSMVWAQLLASHFYETVLAEYAQVSESDCARREQLAAALDACRVIATRRPNVEFIQAQLGAALAILERDNLSTSHGRPSPAVPILRVIQGGLSTCAEPQHLPRSRRTVAAGARLEPFLVA